MLKALRSEMLQLIPSLRNPFVRVQDDCEAFDFATLQFDRNGFQQLGHRFPFP